MNFILKIVLSAVAVLVIANFLPGVSVINFTNAVIVAVVLALLKVTIKPLLIILTLPVTILTLGLFLLFINALIILLADNLIDGFHVTGFWVALLFSLILSLFESILYSFLDK